MAPGPPRATLAAGLAFVLGSFALNSVITRLVVAEGLLDPGLTTAVRFLAGAAALGVVLSWQGSRAGLRRGVPGRASLAPAAWLGAYAFLISYGYVFIGAAAGTFAFYACVLLTMTLFGALAEGRRPGPLGAAGAAVALAGVGVLALGRVEGASPLGVGLLAATGVSWGLYSVLGRRSPDPLGFTAANFFALAAVLVPFTLVVLAFSPVATPAGLALAAGMGAVTTALSYAVWYWALGRIERVEGATYQLLIPVLTAVLGVALLGEALTDRLVLAGALVVLGMALAAAGARAPPDPGGGGSVQRNVRGLK